MRRATSQRGLAVAALACWPLSRLAADFRHAAQLHRPVLARRARLVLLTGVGGMTSFGQAAFVGIGAYATAWSDDGDGRCRPGSDCVLALVLTRLGRGAASGLSRCGWAGIPAARHDRLGSRDLLPVRQSRSARAATTASPASRRSRSASRVVELRRPRFYYLIWGIVALRCCWRRQPARFAAGRAIRACAAAP